MQPIETLYTMLASAGISTLINEPLSKHTSFKIGGPASLFCEPASTEQLQFVLQSTRQLGVPYTLLGKGSNVLFPDNGFAGCVIHNVDLGQGIKCEGNILHAPAGADLAAVCLLAESNCLTGMEFAYGIPGSVGGAVYMNAGAYDGEIKSILQSVEYIDETGLIHRISTKDIELGYRTSIFQQKPWCIISADFCLHSGNKENIHNKMHDFMERRKEKQPLELPNAGSAFKRPPGAFAGALIDQCGLRGYRVGGAAISEKHCGFIVNLGDATCADVLTLAEQVSSIVLDKTGYVLEKEIRVISLSEQNFGAGI